MVSDENKIVFTNGENNHNDNAATASREHRKRMETIMPLVHDAGYMHRIEITSILSLSYYI